MELTEYQKKFIKNKALGYQILKGKEGTGKSTASIYKLLNLENNYCLYEEDRILFVTSNYSKNIEAKELYNNEGKENYFYSLFSLEKNRVDIITLEELINTYYNAYKREKGQVFNIIHRREALKILEGLKEDIEIYYKKSKFLKKASFEFLLDEILWIKASNFSLEEYLNIDRKGRKSRIKKSSYTREAIYNIKEIYNEKLYSSSRIDEYDHALFAIQYVKKLKGLYNHIILDDIEILTKAEIDFVKAIYKEKTYSTFILILNSEHNIKENSWMIKGRKFNSLGIDIKGKTFNFKLKFEGKKKEVNTIEKYQYINLRNKDVVEFNIDTASNNKELLEDEKVIFNEDELLDVPMFNNIAAGNPIEINDNIEGSFYLPKYWLEKGKESFILRVKGDSMVDKNICDGDLVVIKKQATANHNDIVAANLEGEATLKTLNLNSDTPKLMPANSLYSPIELANRDVSILGVAIGVIKNN
ncbi:repressor LexA [Clostridium tertium]|uniref:LexA repressor n=1 Tax=Clostridium tertium TaxID=1559 RepID=A0A6N3BS37_9CLOT